MKGGERKKENRMNKRPRKTHPALVDDVDDNYELAVVLAVVDHHNSSYFHESSVRHIVSFARRCLRFLMGETL